MEQSEDPKKMENVSEKVTFRLWFAKEKKKTVRIGYFQKLLLWTIIMIILYIYLCHYIDQILMKTSVQRKDVLRPAKTFYLVDSPFCRIEDIDPFATNVLKYYRVQKPKICPTARKFTYQKGKLVILNTTAMKNYCKGNFTHCEYRTVIRKNENNIEYSSAINFTRITVVDSEFIRVRCFCTDKKKYYANFHAFVHAVKTSKSAKKMADRSKQTTMKPGDKNANMYNKTRFNILMIGLDSVSRLCSHRHLTDTRDFLLRTLGGVELNAYNKVADNTFVNMMPLLYGKYIKEIPWSPSVRKPFDWYDLMWTKYHRHGYRTAFLEDYPGLSMFTGSRVGFAKPPTDHYFRPMAIAMDKERSVWSSGHHCMNERLEVNVHMQFISDFAKIYKSEGQFVFAFFTRLSHDDGNLIGSVDYAFRDFFKGLHEEQLINDTFLFFFSDHGIRFGKFRETLMGKLEERLPMMYIVPPKWFPKRFPKLWNNLKINSHRLTTPFDIHETLLALQNLEEFERNISKVDVHRRGVSLFAQVPENRSCETATILPHWCTCQVSKKLPLYDKTVVRIAGLIVTKINQKLQPEKGKCATLKLDKILQASMTVPNKKLLTYVECKDQNMDIRGVNYGNATRIESSEYQLTVRTLPGSALFETTLRYNSLSKKIDILGEISRTNKYGSQSSCTSNGGVKKYCYCK